AFDRVTSLFRQDYAYPGQRAFSQTNEQIDAAFERGEIAMMFNVNNSVKESLERMEAAGRGRIRVISFPTMASADCDYLLGGCEGFFIPSNTDHPDEAIRLLKFLTSSRIFTELKNQGFAVPVNLGEEEKKITSDSGKVFSQELMNLSSRLYNYINYELPAAYYMDKENTLKELETMRLEAVSVR
ncbi:MAG: extracellular solute-binding protein, partial [Clostridiaceae bacterium]|nr:extracellular solute-binding protein [Clostridiaceae bacterium]